MSDYRTPAQRQLDLVRDGELTILAKLKAKHPEQTHPEEGWHIRITSDNSFAETELRVTRAQLDALRQAFA